MVPYLYGMKAKCFINCFTLANGIMKGLILHGLGYEPADLTMHPPPPRTASVGSFFSYRCLVFPKKCPQRKA